MKSNNLNKLISQTKSASTALLCLDARKRKRVLLNLAKLISQNQNSIIRANLKDIAKSRRNNKSESFIERLSLDRNKIEAMAVSLKQIAV